jgi:hypothetical protein
VLLAVCPCFWNNSALFVADSLQKFERILQDFRPLPSMNVGFNLTPRRAKSVIKSATGRKFFEEKPALPYPVGSELALEG